MWIFKGQVVLDIFTSVKKYIVGNSPVEIGFGQEKIKAKLNFSLLIEMIECNNISKILFNPTSGKKVTSTEKIAIFIIYGLL